MILGLAAVIVQHSLFAIQFGNQQRGGGREHKREVRRGKNMDHIVLANARQQRSHVPHRGHDCTQVLDCLHFSESTGKSRIDGEEPELQRRLSSQARHEPLGLYCLSPQNVERRCDDQHAQLTSCRVALRRRAVL